MISKSLPEKETKMRVNHWTASHNFLNFVVLLRHFTEVVFLPLLGLHTFFTPSSPAPRPPTKKLRKYKQKVKENFNSPLNPVTTRSPSPV